MSNCLFCRIIAGEIPATLVYQDDTVVAFKDINPQAPLHLLLVPKLDGGVLSQVWFVGKWFGAALALASSRVARVVVRGNVSRPVIVLNPFASE